MSTHTPQQIFDDQRAESVDVWEGVTAIIETDYVWKNFIVEGVAVIPELVNQLPRDNVAIKPIFLVDEDINRIREIVFGRGIWDDADTYPDNVKEIEVEWVSLFNKWLKEETTKYGYSPILVTDRTATYNRLIEEVRSWLEEK